MFKNKSRGMGVAVIFVSVLFLSMLGAIIYGMFTVDFNTELNTLLTLPLAQVVTIDLTIGLFVFLGWVIYHEKSILRALPWFIISMGLGNLITTLYVLVALLRSQTWEEFWLGRST